MVYFVIEYPPEVPPSLTANPSRPETSGGHVTIWDIFLIAATAAIILAFRAVARATAIVGLYALCHYYLDKRRTPPSPKKTEVLAGQATATEADTESTAFLDLFEVEFDPESGRTVKLPYGSTQSTWLPNPKQETRNMPAPTPAILEER